MTKILIDLNTLRPNPAAGSYEAEIVVGPITRKETVVDGEVTRVELSRDVMPVHTTLPQSEYLFRYLPTLVECCGCGAVFPHTELESDNAYSEDGEAYSDAVCPRCKLWDCAAIEYEEVAEALARRRGHTKGGGGS